MKKLILPNGDVIHSDHVVRARIHQTWHYLGDYLVVVELRNGTQIPIFCKDYSEALKKHSEFMPGTSEHVDNPQFVYAGG